MSVKLRRPVVVAASCASRHLSNSNAPNTLRTAVVGSGPGGMYAVQHLLKNHDNVTVDVYEKFPTPWGLVRFGVAPDHPEVKVVQNQFDGMLADDRCSFVGNVEVGKTISLERLEKAYDAVVLAYGSPSDNLMGIPGEDLHGVHAARSFVGWYNGHPDHQDDTFDLDEEAAVIIGQGNVALDVARVLCKTVDELKGTDITEQALEALSRSKVKDIFLVGRRGPAQAAFTTKELREMTELSDCHSIVRAEDLELSPPELQTVEKQRARKRQFQLLRKMAAGDFDHNGTKRCHFRFFRNPSECIASADAPNALGAVRLEHTKLENDRAVPVGEFEDIKAGLLFRSIGYKSVPIPGLKFDNDRGVALHQNGRVSPGLYVSGWLKRGPSGIIGTNLPDAKATVTKLLEDEAAGAFKRVGEHPLPLILDELSESGHRVVDYQGWKKLEQVENEKGEAIGKPREKITRVEKMLEAITAKMDLL